MSIGAMFSVTGAKLEGTESTTSSSFSYMGGDEFMQLLLAQLRNQNPLEPLSDSDMMSQFTQLNSLDQLQKINGNLIAMSLSNELLGAAGLLGKVVEVVMPDGQNHEAQVTGISFSNGQVMLWLGEEAVPLSSLIAVHEVSTEDE